MRNYFFHLFAFLFLLPVSETSLASPYVELGTSLAKLSSLDEYFGLNTQESNSNLGFCGSLSLYFPLLPSDTFQIDLGIQNRMYFVSTETPNKIDLTMVTTSISARFQISRFYVGGGYAPVAFSSKNGPLGISTNPAATAFFLEGGVIWRVVPELQIVATYAMEYGMLSTTTFNSPSPATEYGLRFRFPLSPYSKPDDASSKFDGFRYPFGFMRD